MSVPGHGGRLYGAGSMDALALRLLFTLCTGVLALWFTQETALRNEKGATLTQYIKVGALWFWGALALILISLAIAFLLAKAEKKRALFSRDDAVHAEHGQNN